MRKLLFIFAAMMTVALVGCKKGAQDAEPEEIKLSVDPSSINSPAFGADYLLTLTAPDAWTAECADSWVKVNPTSGNAGTVEISVKISANKESAESNSKIVFKSGDQTFELPVKRAAKDPARLRITTEKAIQTPKDGGDYAIKVESNIKWTISSNVSWAKVQGEAIKRDNATVNISVDEATTPEETTALIIVKPFGEGAEAGEDTVVITRGGTDATSMVISQNEVNAPSNGGSYTINVTSNAKWRVYTSWDADWLMIKNGEGDGNGSFAIQVNPATSGNDASTVVTVEEVRTDSYKPVQLNILVNRDGLPAANLSVDPASIDAPLEGGEFALHIKCNHPWTASLIGTKIFSVSAAKGDGDGIMVVTVKPATDNQEATGKIIIKSSYGGEQQEIPIHRAAVVLDISPKGIDAPYSGVEYTVNVTCNTDWAVSSSNDKVAAVSPTSGSGNGSFKFTVGPSYDFDGYSVTITVSTIDGSVSQKLKIIGAGIEKCRYLAFPFSVSATKQVYFSPGNLQYQASTNKWRFADRQYEYVGTGKEGFVYSKNVKSDNLQIAQSYDGWIDLFGWGTGANPTLHTKDPTHYSTFTEWGSNKIIYYDKFYPADTWRTLERSEWLYILNERTDAEKLRGNAEVKGVKGLVLLPDGWRFTSALPFVSNTTDFSLNIIPFDHWQGMEALGAVFLPMAGYRIGAEEVRPNHGEYWSATPNESNYIYYFIVGAEGSKVYVTEHKYEGYSVRLVQDVE